MECIFRYTRFLSLAFGTAILFSSAEIPVQALSLNDLAPGLYEYTDPTTGKRIKYYQPGYDRNEDPMSLPLQELPPEFIPLVDKLTGPPRPRRRPPAPYPYLPAPTVYPIDPYSLPPDSRSFGFPDPFPVSNPYPSNRGIPLPIPSGQGSYNITPFGNGTIATGMGDAFGQSYTTTPFGNGFITTGMGNAFGNSYITSPFGPGTITTGMGNAFGNSYVNTPFGFGSNITGMGNAFGNSYHVTPLLGGGAFVTGTGINNFGYSKTITPFGSGFSFGP